MCLRRELQQRTGWLGTSLQPFVEKALTSGTIPDIAALAQELRSHDEALGLAIYDAHCNLVHADGPPRSSMSCPPALYCSPLSTDPTRECSGAQADQDWLEEAVPLACRRPSRRSSGHP